MYKMNPMNLTGWKKILVEVWFCIILAGIAAGAIWGALTGIGKLCSRYDDYAIYRDGLELKHEAAKSNLVDAAQHYIDSVAPDNSLSALVLVNECLENDMDICFVLAQGHKESHFGTKGMARKTNSVWNVMAFDGKTAEQISHQGKYRTPNESIKPYITLLRNRYIRTTEVALLVKFVDHDGHRYASDPGYEAALTELYKKIKTETGIDSLTQQVRKYELLLD